jgi:hypothetical protein
VWEKLVTRKALVDNGRVLLLSLFSKVGMEDAALPECDDNGGDINVTHT